MAEITDFSLNVDASAHDFSGSLNDLGSASQSIDSNDCGVGDEFERTSDCDGSEYSCSCEGSEYLYVDDEIPECKCDAFPCLPLPPGHWITDNGLSADAAPCPPPLPPSHWITGDGAENNSFFLDPVPVEHPCERDVVVAGDAALSGDVESDASSQPEEDVQVDSTADDGGDLESAYASFGWKNGIGGGELHSWLAVERDALSDPAVGVPVYSRADYECYWESMTVSSGWKNGIGGGLLHSWWAVEGHALSDPVVGAPDEKHYLESAYASSRWKNGIGGGFLHSWWAVENNALSIDQLFLLMQH